MTENKRFERIYADVDVFCRDHNAKGASQLIEREDYDRIVDLLNEQHEQIERLKGNFRALDEVKCELAEENEQLKQELNNLKKFEYGGEHIRLSINIETGELQRHIYATGQWFGDFDRVLVDNWLSKEDYQRFINRVIEVYNTEFKGDV